MNFLKRFLLNRVGVGTGFSCYAIKDLAVYSFSNLLDIINYRNELLGIPEAMYDHLYPIPREGKETFVKWKVKQRIEQRH